MIYSQTDSIYEQSLTTALKPKSEMYRPHMYTMWDEAHKHSENVCGVYVNIYDNYNAEFDITFEVSIQLDDLLPLSGMSILPTCVIVDIELEIRNRIQGNLVYCQVDPNVLLDEYLANAVSSSSELDSEWTEGGSAVSLREWITDIKDSLADSQYTKEFT